MSRLRTPPDQFKPWTAVRHSFKLPSSKPVRIAICDAPKVLSRALRETLLREKHEVVYEGKFDDRTMNRSRRELSRADIWLTKWSFNLDQRHLGLCRPKIGIISLTAGTDHIDKEALAKFRLKLETTEKFSSISVAEQALALAFRGSCPRRGCVLPPLALGQLVFRSFSDEYAEAAVAQILMRVRQVEAGMENAKKYNYGRCDAPWGNGQLTHSRIGIIGRDRSADRLAQILHDGFGCDIFGFDTPETMDAFYIRDTGLLEMAGTCDYLFLCTDRFGRLGNERSIDSRELEMPDIPFGSSTVGVLGTGSIGSIIATMASKGFGSDVLAFSRSQKPDLLRMNVRYVPDAEKAVSRANYLFIALPLKDDTRQLLSKARLSRLSTREPHAIINVTRDGIIDTEHLMTLLESGVVSFYATDVVPGELALLNRKPPPELTTRLLGRADVIATPHYGDASAYSIERLKREVLQRISEMAGGAGYD